MSIVKLFDEHIAQVATETFDGYKVSRTRMYLYYIASDDTHGGRMLPLRSTEDIPLGAKLADPESIPINLTLPALRGWVRWRAVSLPILPIQVEK